jgi:hypothetical protein
LELNVYGIPKNKMNIKIYIFIIETNPYYFCCLPKKYQSIKIFKNFILNKHFDIRKTDFHSDESYLNFSTEKNARRNLSYYYF